MAKNKFVINIAGFRELRNSEAVQSVLLEHASNVRQRADALANDPGGFIADVMPGRNRAHAVVKPVTRKAVAKCADQNVLLKAVGV